MDNKRIFILFSALSLTALSGCFQNAHVRGVVVVPAETHSHTSTVVTHYEPPPHAPAHGHRQHHHDHDLLFDSAFGAYLVIGSPGLYFYDNHYMRFYGGNWQITSRIGRTWHPAKQQHIPHKLRKRHANRHHAEKHREQRHQKRHEKKRQRHNEHYDERHDRPRHGHRRQHHGHNLIYDIGVGAYIISKRPGIYFFNDHYLRHHRGEWQRTKKLNGKWRRAKNHHIPGKLRKHKRHRYDRHDRRDNSGKNGRKMKEDFIYGNSR